MKCTGCFYWLSKKRKPIQDIILEDTTKAQVDTILETIQTDKATTQSIIDVVIDECIEISEEFKHTAEHVLERVDEIAENLSNSADAVATSLFSESDSTHEKEEKPNSHPVIELEKRPSTPLIRVELFTSHGTIEAESKLY